MSVYGLVDDLCVKILAPYEKGEKSWLLQGSGYTLAQNLVLTAHHIVSESIHQKYQITIVWPGKGSLQASCNKMVWFDEECDLALLQFDGVNQSLHVEPAHTIMMYL